MKTKEELNELKEEVEALNKKLAELTEDELAGVAGGESDDWNTEDIKELFIDEPEDEYGFLK